MMKSKKRRKTMSSSILATTRADEGIDGHSMVTDTHPSLPKRVRSSWRTARLVRTIDAVTALAAVHYRRPPSASGNGLPGGCLIERWASKVEAVGAH